MIVCKHTQLSSERGFSWPYDDMYVCVAKELESKMSSVVPLSLVLPQPKLRARLNAHVLCAQLAVKESI